MHKMTACPSPSELHTCYHDVFVFRSTVSKIYFAMFIENVTELAFQPLMMLQLKILTFPAYKVCDLLRSIFLDWSNLLPDVCNVSGLAEAGLISSKPSRRDTQSSADGEQSPLFFSPDRSGTPYTQLMIAERFKSWSKLSN
ncbi:unnamed protein product [Cuscuta epithymum]|uniref:Uncharacterized protein n=1 Tax=Cuscuta epithymum TaxID=186058 RepID=A0AAV0FQ62_9ASTE|nr:unnamed protein product [Cuscuta epithymum]